MPNIHRYIQPRRVDSVRCSSGALIQERSSWHPQAPTRRSFASLALLLVLIGTALPQTVHAASQANSSAIPDLTTFVSSVTRWQPQGTARRLRQRRLRPAGGAADVRGRRFPGGRDGDPVRHGAERTGLSDLLAHNYLSGQQFFELTVGQPINLVYGDGRIEAFRVTRILRFQATIPESANSGFINLDTGKGTDAEGLFRQVYMGSRHVTFQTCIEEARELELGAAVRDRGAGGLGVRRRGDELAGRGPTGAEQQ